MNIATISYKDGNLILLDQRALPTKEEYFTCKTVEDVEFAIKDMVVRGAPAIGASAAFGLAIAARISEKEEDIRAAADLLRASRPTAVNLMWAIDRMLSLLETSTDYKNDFEKEAFKIYEEDISTNHKMAAHGNSLIAKGDVILTHCNTGALATAGYGTALGVIREAHRSGKEIYVYADETRPRLQGARLTAWELMKEQIPSTLIADNVAATLIRDGKIDKILVGADRIAINGDTANKIGTFMLAAVAKLYHVPFYIVAPTTTIDYEISSGEEIEIEERSSREVTHVGEEQISPQGMKVYNPAFDVTPHDYITGIITEEGVLYPPFDARIRVLKETL